MEESKSATIGIAFFAITIFAMYFFVKYIISVFRRTGAPMYCTTCGHEGPTAIRAKGSILIEIVLWVCFIVPGLVYSIWRGGSRQKLCKNCGAATVIPPTSPIASESKRRMGA